MTRRFYAPQGWPEGQCQLDEAESHHLLRVLRGEPGLSVELFDGRGGRGQGTLIGATGKRALVRVEQESREPRSAGLVLATAVPKGDRFAWLVEKATELGVSRLCPIIAKRSVVDPGSGKLDKLRGAVVEACKQCGRTWLMEIDDPLPLDKFLTRQAGIPPAEQPLLLVGHPGGAPLRTITTQPGRDTVIVIGPEGGLDEREVAAVVTAGGLAVSLGRHILRMETAALAAAVWHAISEMER